MKSIELLEKALLIGFELAVEYAVLAQKHGQNPVEYLKEKLKEKKDK